MRALNKNNIDVRYAEVGGERTMQDRRVKDGHLLLLNINYDTHSANHTTYIISNFFFTITPPGIIPTLQMRILRVRYLALTCPKSPT